jgi:hypothetical protein
VSETCLAKNMLSTCYAMGGDPVGCDEPGDCPVGQRCYVASNAPLTTGCQASGLGPALCKNDADCAPGTGTCITQTCNSALGRPEIISTCGGSGWCTGHP